MSDPDSGLVGRADRIEPVGTSCRIVDLKTGLHQEAPTEEQRRQLLLYADLVHATTGNWPASIAIEDASGTTYELPLDPAEAETVAQEVSAAVAAFNHAVASGSLESDAEPNAERCRWCPYRLVCSRFWESVSSDWKQRAATGMIVDRGVRVHGSFVVINMTAPADYAGNSISVTHLPEALPSDATSAAIVDWSGPPGPGNVTAGWSTLVRTW